MNGSRPLLVWAHREVTATDVFFLMRVWVRSPCCSRGRELWGLWGVCVTWRVDGLTETDPLRELWADKMFWKVATFSQDVAKLTPLHRFTSLFSIWPHPPLLSLAAARLASLRRRSFWNWKQGNQYCDNDTPVEGERCLTSIKSSHFWSKYANTNEQVTKRSQRVG